MNNRKNIHDEVTNAVMNLNVQNIVYDDIGNREQSTVYSDQSAVTNLYVANQLNQYTSMNSGGSARNLTHDDDGNLTCDGAQWHHAYDGENRLVSSSNLISGVLCEYAYDYQSRRISKTTLTPNPYSSLTTKYIWDGWNIAAEIIIDHITPVTNINYYTWGLDLSGTLQGAGGVGGLLSDTKVSSSETNAYFAVGDANGNVTEYVDSTGAIAAHGEHNAFGETKLSGSMKDQFTHWFSTKPFDRETGLVVYQRRYYDPLLGVWLSRDPITEDGGKNLYLLGNNNAINKWDYLGLASISWDEYGRMKHFGQLKEQLKRQLKALCPKSPTSWRKNGWRIDECCRPKTCKEEAERMAEAYINALHNASRLRRYPGGYLGNVCIFYSGGGITGGGWTAGKFYSEIEEQDLTCGGWVDMASEVLTPLTTKSKCWGFKAEKARPVIFGWTRHMWASVQVMNGAEIHLDPYSSGGKYY
ncbi:MAG: RHS repeat-associated core domain-containing protein [Bacteroidales bacterium]|nr:RHS repeat-associated core domain-containing protein [Bacteroidales bacterium]